LTFDILCIAHNLIQILPKLILGEQIGHNMRKGYYYLVVLLFLSGWGCSQAASIQTSILKPKESDFRNYTILKITDLDHSPPYEVMQSFPDRLAKEIEGENLFKTVQRIQRDSAASSDRRTLVLKVAVTEYSPGTGEGGTWWGGYIVLQCSVIEKMTNSEIFICKLSSSIGTYMEEDIDRGLRDISNGMINKIAGIIQQGW